MYGTVFKTMEIKVRPENGTGEEVCSTSQPRHCHTQREISKVPKEKTQKTTDRQEPLPYLSLFMGLVDEELVFSITVHSLETAGLEWDPNTKCLQFLVLITSLCVFKTKNKNKNKLPPQQFLQDIPAPFFFFF